MELMSFFSNIGRLCRDMPGDGKGCRFWTYVTTGPFGPAQQDRTCYLLNSCEKVVQTQGEVISGERSCDPLAFLKALGEILFNNIDALKGVKQTVDAMARRRTERSASINCTEFVVLVKQSEFTQEMILPQNNLLFTQVTGLPPQSPDIVSVAADIESESDKIMTASVSCSAEAMTELIELTTALDKLIASTEAVLAGLQFAMKDATGTTAAYTMAPITTAAPQGGKISCECLY